MHQHYTPRCLAPTEKHSFFLFGPRNTGKSTLLAHIFHPDKTHTIDLLNIQTASRFHREPDTLYDRVMALPDTATHVVIDEIQKVPKLLDVVQRLMKDTTRYFILTGSSARKLKQGGANLLAGRAFVYHLHPYSFIEVGDKFKLNMALNWGLLPELVALDEPSDKENFLYAYAHTYLKEEIWEEQYIKDLDPFRHFLEVAAQSNGKIINFANVARDVGVDDKTIKRYYAILEDTLIGFFLTPFQNSFRKRLSSKPKFYFFDTGVTRCLNRMISAPLIESTHAYGDAFEHFVILEIMKLASYFRRDYRFSYIRTLDDVEVDLVIDRPNQPRLCIEIKSNAQVSKYHLSSFIRITKDIPNSEAICLSRDEYAIKYDHVTVMPWQDGIRKIFNLNRGALSPSQTPDDSSNV